MKIGIYSEASGGGLGGSEYSVAVLGEALGRGHEVDIIHHRPSLTRSQFTEIFGIDLTTVRLRYVEYERNISSDGHNPWRRYQQAKAWHATLSEPYDLFINFTHNMPSFCHARVGVLMLLFPTFDRPNAWPWKDDASDGRSFLWKRLRHSYYEWEWRRRLDTYCLKTANSQFTKKWTQYRWGINCQVVYPPVDNRFSATDKGNIILSVGRFATKGVNKHQLEMVTVFRRMVEEGLRGWKYFCVGALGNSPLDNAYFENVSHVGAVCEAQVLANIERAKLRGIYEQAKVFWHAAGYGDDESQHPELQEHFGIVTVEAMAAGCVPVVINKGGQREIVEHGVNGFLWNSLDELVDYTTRLAKDDRLRARMSTEARVRSQYFDRKNFVEKFQTLLKPFLA